MDNRLVCGRTPPIIHRHISAGMLQEDVVGIARTSSLQHHVAAGGALARRALHFRTPPAIHVFTAQPKLSLPFGDKATSYIRGFQTQAVSLHSPHRMATLRSQTQSPTVYDRVYCVALVRFFEPSLAWSVTTLLLK